MAIRAATAAAAAIRGNGYTPTLAAERNRKEYLSKLARGDEQCRILTRDIDIDVKTWTFTQGKTGDVNVTPLFAPAIDILRNRLGASRLSV